MALAAAALGASRCSSAWRRSLRNTCILWRATRTTDVQLFLLRKEAQLRTNKRTLRMRQPIRLHTNWDRLAPHNRAVIIHVASYC